MTSTITPSLERYRGPWTRAEAAHLLRRVAFGPTVAEIDAAMAAGLEATLERWFTPQPEDDPADADLLETARSLNSPADLKAWWHHRLLTTRNPLAERMTLFWHNHFATSITKVTEVKLMADQNQLFRTHALGSFRAMVTAVAKDPAMVLWLDGNANRRRHANENFARELMELFTLGVGHYTERDIQEAARAFTGWHTRFDQFWFNAGQHDDGDKSVLGKAGKLNGEDVIDACLAQRAAPRFLATKLLRTFVHDQPSEAQVDALAAAIRQHDFDMGAVLRQLLRSELFFAAGHRACLIKGPLDYSLGTVRMLGVVPNLSALVSACARQGQDVFAPPTVEGWKGGRRWINSASLLERANFANLLLTTDRVGTVPDLAAWAAAHGATTPEAGVDFLADALLAAPLDSQARERLLDYWNSATLPTPARVRALVTLLVTLPEYHLV